MITNKEKLFNQLEQIAQVEKQIEQAGVTTIKPLVQRYAKLNRQALATLAMEVFSD